MADLVGQTLGNYRIESRLGSGGMGAVYRATHVHLNRPAAIKVLHANQASDPTFQARFLREARAAAALSHPNIVEVFDFGEQDGASYLVMELVPDGSLRSLLRQRASSAGWSLGLGVDLVRQAAEGLGYAHTHGMIHRDIKPDNLLLQKVGGAAQDAETERYLLKISDFGLARLMEDTGELTQTGVVMGTPAYMSPEQCQGGALDGRSDLYSLGIVLYEVATGSPPFRVRTLSEAVFKHISAPPVPPREVFPDLPLALEDVIMRCLAKRPEDRFASGGELADALDGALGDTELRTIVPTISATIAPTPAPTPLQSPADANAPTVAATPRPSPAPHVLSPPAVETPAASTALTASDADSTIRASRMPAMPTPAPQRAEAVATPAVEHAVESVATPVADPAAAAPPPLTPSMVTPVAPPLATRRWPGASDNAGGASATSGLAELFDSIPLSRPWKLGLGGGGALALVIILIVVLASGNHGAQKAAVNGAPSVSHTPTVRASATSTASPTPAGTVIYQAPLTSAARNWPNSSHSYFANGGYVLSGAWIAYSPSPSVGDGLISVRMRQLGGPADQFYGLLFRGANDNLYYFYGISGSQQWTFSLVAGGNGKPLIAPTTDSHIAAGSTGENTIAVRATGGHFVFYVNGAQVGQADDATISSGRIGLINTVGNLSVIYNDFTVTGPA